jgi:hypothetical protein
MGATVSCRVRGIVGGVREKRKRREGRDTWRICEADALYDGRVRVQQQAGMQAHSGFDTHTTKVFPRRAKLSKRAGTIRRRIAVGTALVAFMHCV